jgi:hypothetical protein
MGVAACKDYSPAGIGQEGHQPVGQQETRQVIQSKLLLIAILCGRIPTPDAAGIVYQNLELTLAFPDQISGDLVCNCMHFPLMHQISAEVNHFSPGNQCLNFINCRSTFFSASANPNDTIELFGKLLGYGKANPRGCAGYYHRPHTAPSPSQLLKPVELMPERFKVCVGKHVKNTDAEQHSACHPGN